MNWNYYWNCGEKTLGKWFLDYLLKVLGFDDLIDLLHN